MQTDELRISTQSRTQFVSVTGLVADLAGQHGWRDGLLTVFVPHTTAGVTINENADPDVARDMVWFSDQLVPRSTSFRHAEGNSDAHIKASFGTVSKTTFRLIKMMRGNTQVCQQTIDLFNPCIFHVVFQKPEISLDEIESLVIWHVHRGIFVLVKGIKFSFAQCVQNFSRVTSATKGNVNVSSFRIYVESFNTLPQENRYMIGTHSP